MMVFFVAGEMSNRCRRMLNSPLADYVREPPTNTDGLPRAAVAGQPSTSRLPR